MEYLSNIKKSDYVITKFGKDERKRFMCELHAFEYDCYLHKYKFPKSTRWKNKTIMDRFDMPIDDFLLWI